MQSSFFHLNDRFLAVDLLIYVLEFVIFCFSNVPCARSKFWGVVRGGGDNSIQLINFGRVGDKSFKE